MNLLLLFPLQKRIDMWFRRDGCSAHLPLGPEYKPLYKKGKFVFLAD